MRLIDGNKIVMSLADGWYSSFGQEETEESKAIKKVMDQVEKMVMEMPETVHCEDCEFCIVEEPISRGIIPDMYCRIWESNVITDDYCSYGRKQITGKLNNPDDSLVTEDSEACKEQESKLDLIRREDAIDAIDDAIDADSPLQWAILRTKIGFLPSADRPKGKWVEFRKPCYDGTSYYWKKCSVCDHDMIGYETNFCPNCGCDCRGDKE